MNLVAANLMTNLMFLPMVLADMEVQMALESFCSTLKGFSILTGSASMLAQLLIGIDQHLAVVNPLHYHRRINELKCHILCCSTWIISIGT